MKISKSYILKLLAFIFVPIVFSLFPFFSSAAEILNDTEILLVREKVYEENLYIGAGKSVIEAKVNGDLVIFGGDVTVSSEISDDLFVFGGSVVFKGNVSGDVRVVGGKIKIDGKVSGDVLAIGGEIEIAEKAEITNGISIFGGRVFVKNNSQTSIKIIAGTVDLSGQISGKTEITTQNLKIINSANISGDFYYYSPQKMIADAGAIISAKINFNEINSIREMGIVKQAILSFMNFWFLLKFITTLILAFILVYVFKVFSQGTTNLALNSFWKSFLIGILALIVLPVIVLLFIASLVALPIGFLLFIFLISVIIIAPAIAAIFLGTWLKRYFGKIDPVDLNKISFRTATIGVIIMTLLQFVPYVGDLIRVVLMFVAIGAIFRQIRLLIVR